MNDVMSGPGSAIGALDPDRGTDLFALMCARRGWTPERLTELDDPSHPDLKDLDAMAEALHIVHESGERIVIIPDFDMDGISSGVLGHAGLAELGFTVGLHIPDYRRGHDVGPADMAEIAARFPDTSVVITCDGGVNGAAGVADAHARGWRVLVTDHHEELDPGSSADITVDPCRIDESYPLPGICGAVVLYRVLERYTERFAPEKTWEIGLLRLFAGLGTVSDVMPLVYENRQMVRDSLSIARLLRAPAPTIENQWGDLEPDPANIDITDAPLRRVLDAKTHHPVFTAALEGFSIMLAAFERADKLRGDINEDFYGFYLAPAFNSPRRIGTSVGDCFTVFAPGDAAARVRAAERIIEGNETRKEMVASFAADLVSADQPLAPWVWFSDAPGGMLGLLANRMMSATGEPAVVLQRPRRGVGPVSGSGRAPDWFGLIEALEPIEGVYGIGHQQACGIKVADVALTTDLAERLAGESARLHAGATRLTGPAADLVLGSGPGVDAGLEASSPLIEFVERTETLRPFGHGFPAPVVELVLDTGSCRLDRIGSEGQHLSLMTRSGFKALWWNAAADHGDELEAMVGNPDTGPLHLSGHLSLNTFRGTTSVQGIIESRITG